MARIDSTNPPPGAGLPESRFSVILVETLYPDNLGHVARSMLNFGVGDLRLIRPHVALDNRARERAVHAQAVLDHARHHECLAEARSEFDHLVGFAARISLLNKAHLRMSEDLERVAQRLESMPGRVGLVFGREDTGLGNAELEHCDMVCTIPTSEHYRSMNLSHAVTVALYEMTRPAHARVPYVSMATPQDKDILFASWLHLTRSLGFKPHRQEQTLQMIQRVVGRSGLTAWEYHRFMGVLSRSLKRLGAWPPPDVGSGLYREPPEGAQADDADDADPARRD